MRNLGGNLGNDVGGGSDHLSRPFMNELLMKEWYDLSLTAEIVKLSYASDRAIHVAARRPGPRHGRNSQVS